MSNPKVWANYFAYLDKLRASGETNMFASTPFVAKRFNISQKTAIAVVAKWMETYSDEPVAVRAARVSDAHQTT